MHNYKKTGYIQNQGYSHAPIIIGEDNWLGAHAVIFPGVNLGKGCIVGSNAVVTKSFNAAEVIVGVAASSISKRKSD